MNSQFLTITVFLLASALIYFGLASFTYSGAFSLAFALFAAQLALTEVIESFVITRFRAGSFWFVVFMAPGTILHEMCHLVAAIICGCKILKVSLFKPNPKTGVLGYVSYAQPRGQLIVFKEAFIGLAPFFGCGMMIFFLDYLFGGSLHGLLSDPTLLQGGVLGFLRGFYSFIPSNVSPSLAPLHLSVFAYLTVCFSFGAAPSPADFSSVVKSMTKNIPAGLLFAFAVASSFPLSEGSIDFFGYGSNLQKLTVDLLLFTLSTLTFSVSVLIVSLPVSLTVTGALALRGFYKFLPFALAIASYLILINHLPWHFTVFSFAFLFTSATLLLHSKS